MSEYTIRLAHNLDEYSEKVENAKRALQEMNDFEVKLWQEKTVQNPTDNEGVDMGYTFSLPDGKSTVDEVFEIAQNAVRKEPSLDRLTKRQVQLIIKAYEDVTGMYDET